MLKTITSGSASFDLRSTAKTVCTYTNSTGYANMFKVAITLVGKYAASGTYQLSILLGSTNVAGSPSDLDLGSATTYTMWTDDILIPNGVTATVTLLSPNTSTGQDNAVTVSYIVYDANPLASSLATRPEGQASNIEEMIVQLWSRFFGKVEFDKLGNTLKTYDVNDEYEATLQTIDINPSTQVEIINAATEPV